MRTRYWGLLVAMCVSACADIAGIEPGHLHVDDSIDTGGAGAHAGGAGKAGTSGSTGSSAGSSGAAMAGANAEGGAGSGGSSGASTGGAGSAGQTGGAAGAGGALGGSSGAAPGGAGGMAGMAGTGGASAPCPTGMIQSTSTQHFAYCIDATEVTNAQYLAFTKQHTPANTSQRAACSTNTTFVPASACGGAPLTDVPSAEIPVVCVDWCDSEAFCSAQGKHLCGRVGGTANPQSDAANAAASEWYAACTGPSMAAVSGNTCNDGAYDPNHPGPKAASQLPDCEGGLPGLFEMSGNVAEWENSCPSESSTALCNTRGGSFEDGPFELNCSSANTAKRLTASIGIGFRCCADSK